MEQNNITNESESNIDSNEINDVQKEDISALDETMTTTKGFRVTVATKKRIAKIEEATSLSGDDLIRQLLDSYDILNYRENEVSDEFEELKTILSRVQSIFLNSRERLNTQSTIISNRLNDTIKNLNSQISVLSTELINTKEHNEKEIEHLKDSHLIDIAKLEKDLREKEQALSKVETEIKEKDQTIKEVSKTLKETEETLSNYTHEQNDSSKLLQDKDNLISELTDKHTRMSQELEEVRNKNNDLVKENNSLLNEIERYKLKLENLMELKEQQQILYEKTISIYKNANNDNNVNDEGHVKNNNINSQSDVK